MGKQPEALFDCTKQQWGAPIGIRGAGSRLSFFAANASSWMFLPTTWGIMRTLAMPKMAEP